MVKYDNRWFLSKIKEKRPEDYMDYRFLEPYKTSREKIKAIHIPCGNEINIIPNTFLSRGDGCRPCGIKLRTKKQTKNHEAYEKELPSEITALSQYTGAHNKIKVHCSLCDSTYDIRARDVVLRGCSHCPGGRYTRSIEDIRYEVDQETQGSYTVVSEEYKNAHTKIKIKHRDCERTYEVTIANFRHGRRCPYCKASVGETLVEMFLVKHGIEFLRQKTFEDLRYKSHLSYDFYIPQQNTLIEYQGEQHYKPIKFFGGVEQLKVQRQLDRIKRDYAENNGYNLLELHYTINTYKKVEEYLLTHLIYS